MNAKRNPILSDRLPGVWKFLEDSCLTNSSSRNITNTNLYATIRQSTNNIEYSSSRPSPNLSILCYTSPISPTQPSSIPRQWPLLPTDGHPILSSLHAPASSSAQPSPPTPKPSRLSAATPADNSFTRVEPQSLSSRLGKSASTNGVPRARAAKAPSRSSCCATSLGHLLRRLLLLLLLLPLATDNATIIPPSRSMGFDG